MKKNILKNISKLVGLMIVFSATSCFCKGGDDSIAAVFSNDKITLTTEKDSVNLKDFKLVTKTGAKFYTHNDLKTGEMNATDAKGIKVKHDGQTLDKFIGDVLKKGDSPIIMIELEGGKFAEVKSASIQVAIEKNGEAIKNGKHTIEIKK